MKYLIKGGSGLYPLTSSKEARFIPLSWLGNEIPHQRRLRFIPLTWSGRNEIPHQRRLRFVPLTWSGNEIPHQRRLRFIPLTWLGGILERRDRDGTFGFCTINPTGVLQKDGIGVPKVLKRDLILGASLLRLSNFWNCLLLELVA